MTQFRSGPIPVWVDSGVGRFLCAYSERVDTVVDQIQRGQFLGGSFPMCVNSGVNNSLCGSIPALQLRCAAIPDGPIAWRIVGCYVYV